MKKFFAKMLLLGAFVLVSTAMNAQKVVWPIATDSATIKASQFSDTTQIYVSTTAAPNPPAGFKGWTTTGTPRARWRWTRNGKAAENPSWLDVMQTAAFISPTVTNGSAVFSSEYLDASGIAPVDHIGELTSPTINATGQKDMTVQISQFYYNYYSQIGIAWSEDNGVTWKDTLAINPTVADDVVLNGATLRGNHYVVDDAFEGSFINDVTNIKLTGSVGTDKFKIKFIFEGDSYWWFLDDIRLLVYDNDLQTNRNWFAISPNVLTPKSQVEPNFFLTDISNQGTKAQTNVKTNITIRQNATNTQVYSADYSYGRVNADVSVEDKLIVGSYTPPASVGVYYGRYRMSSDSVDQFRDNDSTRFAFAVSDSVFQKEGGGTSSTRPGDGAWTGNTHSWSVGNHFYVVSGKNFKATKITSMIGNASDLRGKTMIAKLYSWKVPIVPVDSILETVSRANLTEIGAGEVTIASNAADFSFVNIPLINLDPTVTGDIVKLKDTTHYLAMIEFITSDPSSSPAGDMLMTFDTRYDYGAMKMATRFAGKPRFASALGIGVGGTLFLDPFGTEYTPVVRLTIGSLTTDTKESLAAENKFSVYPNPASDMVNLGIDLTKASDITIRVTSVSGKLISEQTFDAVKNERVELNVKGFAAGVYFVQLQTALGSRTERLVIAK
jgi:hypothetical protein